MIKFAVFLITFVLSMTACSGNQFLPKSSVPEQEQILSSQNKILEEEIPVDFFKMIEKEKAKISQQSNLSSPQNPLTIDEIPANFSEIPEHEQTEIINQLTYSTEGQFRSQSPINGIYKDVYEYDLPKKRQVYPEQLFPPENVFDYGIPIKSVSDK